MKYQQISVAAECLRMDPEVAARRARDVRGGMIRVSSDIRGAGSVLVGPDMSVLFFASHLPLEQTLDAWDAGRRTDPHSFDELLRRSELNPRDSSDRPGAVFPGLKPDHA